MKPGLGLVGIANKKTLNKLIKYFFKKRKILMSDLVFKISKK